MSRLQVETAQSAPTISDLVAYEVDPNFTRGERAVTADGDTDYLVGDLIADDEGDNVIAGAAATVLAVVIGGRAVKDGDTANLLTLERGPARIKDTGVRWPAGITELQKTAMTATLAGKDILIVNAVGQYV